MKKAHEEQPPAAEEQSHAKGDEQPRDVSLAPTDDLPNLVTGESEATEETVQVASGETTTEEQVTTA